MGNAGNGSVFMKYESLQKQILNSMLNAGIQPYDPSLEIEVDGKIHRFRTENKTHHKNGWYVIYPNTEIGIPAGAYGDWSLSEESFKWRAKETSEQVFSQKERKVLRKLQEQAIQQEKAEREKQYKQAAIEAERQWNNAHTNPINHHYLNQKHINHHITRIDNTGNLVIPVYDIAGNITSLQFISRDGQKKWFLIDGKTKGCFCSIGEIQNAEKIYIAEGFATAASIFEATNTPTVIAFNAGNLKPVTENINYKYPQMEIIIVADHDENEKGQKGAQAAAENTGARVIIIPNPGEDANDYAVSGGDLKRLLLAEEIKQDQAALDKLQVIFGNELPEKFEPPNELIEGMLCLNDITMVYGASNSGKTFFALEMARVVATEKEKFFNREVDHGMVLYIATESPGSIRSRLQAIRKHHRVNLENIAVIQKPINFFSDNNEVEEVIAAAKAIEKMKGKKIHLIIGDTLARMSAGANENAGVDMGLVMDRFDKLMNHTGAAVAIIHHTGKDAAKGARGWSGIPAHIGTEVEIKEINSTSGDKIRVAEFVKQRQLPTKGEKINFDLKVVNMGLGKFDKDVTTCIIFPTDKEPKPARSKKIQEKIGIFTSAWKNGSKQTIKKNSKKHPFISKEELIEHMIKEKNDKTGEPIKQLTIKQRLKLSDSSSWASKLKDKGIISEHGDGFIFLGVTGEDLLFDENIENLIS